MRNAPVRGIRAASAGVDTTSVWIAAPHVRKCAIYVAALGALVPVCAGAQSDAFGKAPDVLATSSAEVRFTRVVPTAQTIDLAWTALPGVTATVRVNGRIVVKTKRTRWRISRLKCSTTYSVSLVLTRIKKRVGSSRINVGTRACKEAAANPAPTGAGTPRQPAPGTTPSAPAPAPPAPGSASPPASPPTPGPGASAPPVSPVGGAVPVTPPPAPGAPASVFLAPSGSDANTCTSAAPCRTMNRGYRVAAPGSTVEMKAGAYEAQVIQPDASKPSATPVLIRPAPGASVTVFGGLTVGGSNLEIRTVAVAGAVSVENGSQLAVGATNVTLRDIRANLVYVVGRVQGIRVIGGSYGPAVNDHPQVKSYNTSDAFGPRDVLIDGVIFHDFTRSGVGVHTECLQVYDVINITIRNSKFTNCDGTASLAIGKVGTPRLDGVTVENNWFDKRGDAHYAIGLSYDIRNFTFRYNTSSESIAFLNQPSNCSMGTCGPYRFVGNYMPVQYNWCSDVATYAWNVWKGSQCAATDLNVSTMKFVDETGFDLTLAPGSEARDHGDPTDFPTSDIAGVSRPLGGAPDAGARESG